MKHPLVVFVATFAVGIPTIAANAAAIYHGYHAIADGGGYYWGMFVICSALALLGRELVEWIGRE